MEACKFKFLNYFILDLNILTIDKYEHIDSYLYALRINIIQFLLNSKYSLNKYFDLKFS